MPDPQNHLYLVDGSSYIFRAYHRLPPLTNRHGLNVGAVYGYTTMLWKLADGLNKADGPTHMAVILDKSESTFRNEMYDQYKANRPPPPDDLVRLEEALSAVVAGDQDEMPGHAGSSAERRARSLDTHRGAVLVEGGDRPGALPAAGNERMEDGARSHAVPPVPRLTGRLPCRDRKA